MPTDSTLNECRLKVEKKHSPCREFNCIAAGGNNFPLIGMHSTQGCLAIKSHGVTKKRQR